MPSSGDLYRSRLDQILDQRHELVRLASLIDWDRFDLDLLRKSGEPLMKQEDLHAPDTLYERVSG